MGCSWVSLPGKSTWGGRTVGLAVQEEKEVVAFLVIKEDIEVIVFRFLEDFSWQSKGILKSKWKIKSAEVVLVLVCHKLRLHNKCSSEAYAETQKLH